MRGLINSLFIIAIISCALSSCNSIFDAPSAIKTITFSIEPYTTVDDAPLTKTSIIRVDNKNKFIWTQNDTCGVYPDTGSQVWFAMESGAGSGSATFDGGGWAFKPSSTYYSYYPFIGDIYLDRNRIPVSFVGQVQLSTTDIEHIGRYDYMYTEGVTSDESGNLNFSYHHLCCIIRPAVTLPAGTWTKLAITAPNSVFAIRGFFDLMSEQPVIIPTETSKQIQINLEGITLSEETTFQIFVLSAPVNLAGTQITVSVLNDQKAEFQCVKTPSSEYSAGVIGGLTCNSWTQVPQSMGLILEDWGDGGSIGGTAE